MPFKEINLTIEIPDLADFASYDKSPAASTSKTPKPSCDNIKLKSEMKSENNTHDKGIRKNPSKSVIKLDNNTQLEVEVSYESVKPARFPIMKAQSTQTKPCIVQAKSEIILDILCRPARFPRMKAQSTQTKPCIVQAKSEITLDILSMNLKNQEELLKKNTPTELIDNLNISELRLSNDQDAATCSTTPKMPLSSGKCTATFRVNNNWKNIHCKKHSISCTDLKKCLDGRYLGQTTCTTKRAKCRTPKSLLQRASDLTGDLKKCTTVTPCVHSDDIAPTDTVTCNSGNPHQLNRIRRNEQRLEELNKSASDMDSIVAQQSTSSLDSLNSFEDDF